MDCVKIKKILSAYIDGDLDARTHESVRMHLQKCKGCMEEFVSLKEMIFELGSLDKLETPKGLIEKIHERIESPSRLEKLGLPLFFPLKIKLPIEITALAATAALIFLIFNGIQPDRNISDNLKGNGKGIVSMDSGKDNKRLNQFLAENKPVQLVIRLESAEKNKPLSSENVIPVASGASQRGLKQYGSDPLERNDGKWMPDDPFEDIENTFSDKTLPIFYQNDFISDINIIITHLGGRILSKEYEKDTDILQYITLEIPVVNYRPFLTRLEHIASLQAPAPENLDGQKDNVQIRIRIIT